MAAAKLTPKQSLFAQEYLIDLDATKAAIRSGYSAKTAHAAGHKLLKDPRIAKLIREGAEKRAERTQIDADWVLKRLAEEADADVNDLFDADGALKPVKDWPLIWRKGLVAGIDVETTYSKTGKKKLSSTLSKIKVSDRVKRLELIGKHVFVGAFSDKHEHTGPNGGPIEAITREMTPEEASRIYMERVRGKK